MKNMNVKPTSQSRKKYEDASGRAGAAYKDGIRNSTGWKEKAIAGEALYAAKVQEAIAAGRRAKALEAVSEEDWKNNAINKGSARIGAGMKAGAGKWEKNWAPYGDTLKGVNLPARTASGMDNLMNRAGAVVQAMENKKKEIKG